MFANVCNFCPIVTTTLQQNLSYSNTEIIRLLVRKKQEKKLPSLFLGSANLLVYNVEMH